MSNPQPQEQDNRRRRKPRKPPADANAGDEAVQTDETAPRPKQKNQNKKKKTPQQNDSALSEQLQEAGAATPPRPSTGNANRISDQEGQIGTQKGTHKKKNANPNNAAGNKQHRNTTPSKPQISTAYAGPTFHASPAPSALPIPSRFSRSAPSNDITKEVGIRARLQQEDSTGSSGGDSIPNSPLARPSAQRVVSQGDVSGGPALFDMLINADREEKARLQRQTLSPPQANTRENSVSPVHAQTLPRSQHNRFPSEGGPYPLEASTANAQSSAHAARQPAQLGTPYGHFSQQPHPDDAKLKRMLFSSPSQGTPSHAYSGPPAGPQWDSPASRASASPYDSPASSNGLASSSRPAPMSPYTQASPSPSARRSAYPPHHNSNLRRELSPGGLNHTPPSLGNLPRYNPGNGGSPLASPTQQRFTNRNSPFSHGGYNSPNRNSQDDSRRFSAQDALNSIGQSAQTSEMEDRLRQMLRIGQVRPQGTQSPNAATAGAVQS